MNQKDLNIPNIVTCFRGVIVPVFIYLILQPSKASHVVALGLFIIASITDLVDGYLARKLNQETELGRFLDPLADKFLVLGAFITFIFLSEQIKVWMVLCIVSRDILITLLRYLAIYQGRTVRTSKLAKIKTAFQMFSVFVIITSFMLITVQERGIINQEYREAMDRGLSSWEVAWSNLLQFLGGHYEGLFMGLASFLPYYLMVLTTAITIVSVLRYLFTNYELFLGSIPVVRPRKRANN